MKIEFYEELRVETAKKLTKIDILVRPRKNCSEKSETVKIYNIQMNSSKFNLFMPESMKNLIQKEGKLQPTIILFLIRVDFGQKVSNENGNYSGTSSLPMTHFCLNRKI